MIPQFSGPEIYKWQIPVEVSNSPKDLADFSAMQSFGRSISTTSPYPVGSNCVIHVDDLNNV